MGMGGPVGLDYPAVFAVASVLGIDMTKDLLFRVGVIEREHLEVLNAEYEHGRQHRDSDKHLRR